MIRYIVLDSGPLGLVLQRPGYHNAQQCREWLARHAAAGSTVLLPEIIDYEVRRELLRLRLSGAIRRLERLYSNPYVKPLELTSEVLHRAAELWAQARRQGMPTADPHALDIDVILAAQVLLSGIPEHELVVATGNTVHLGQFVPAEEWAKI